jgi:hypothetical protein
MDWPPIFLSTDLSHAEGRVAVAGLGLDITDSSATFESQCWLALRKGEHMVEPVNCGIWAADKEAWFSQSQRPTLRDRERAVSIAPERPDRMGCCRTFVVTSARPRAAPMGCVLARYRVARRHIPDCVRVALDGFLARYLPA